MLRLASLLFLLGAGFFIVTASIGDQPRPLAAAEPAAVSRAAEPAAVSRTEELPPARPRGTGAPQDLPGVSYSSRPVLLDSVAPSAAMVQLSAAGDFQRAPAEGLLTASAGQFRQVIARSANVRGGPSTGNPVLGRLSQGDEVAVVTEADNGWLLIRVEGDGLEGWVSASLLSR